MVTLSQFDETVEVIKESFYQLIKHPYLDRYLADPIVDEDRVRFLFAMLQGRMAKEDVELYTVSTLLVQAALEIHESIPLKIVSESIERKKGQLEVLAGDYYSSLYYYLLAKKEQLPMVQVFSRTIQTMNECKMNTYGDHQLTFAEVEKNVMFVESILIQKIAQYFSCDGWDILMNDFFYFKHLLFERQQWLNGDAEVIVRSLLKECEKRSEVESSLDARIGAMKDQLITRSKEFGEYEQLIIEMINNVEHRMSLTEKIGGER